MNIARIENLINEHGNENAELLADLDELRRQNTEYDNDFNRIKEANDTLTSALENSRAENKRLLGLVNDTTSTHTNACKPKPIGHFIKGGSL
jgi:hypothetical protein|nr:MAG TPA: hypothetical protein [Caudoviricetes sp.]